ncbi:MAG: threonine/serine dehydratase [Calditrichaeota bacterium]|nr:MAG: threonine/serine dehydratase [Calditrichota bacterium]
MAHNITLKDVLLAKQRIAPFIKATPTLNFKSLDTLFGCELWIKFENHLPTGAFKIRGGINLCSQLKAQGFQGGLIAASTGNHGQSVAHAGQLFGFPVKIIVPEKANMDKVRAMENFGAEVIFHGKNYSYCCVFAENFASDHDWRYVSGGDEPALVPGVGTYALELLETMPKLDTIFVPVGGGSGASGTCIVAHSVNPAIKVVGVQSTHADSIYQSMKTGKFCKTQSADTFAEGLATLQPFEYTLDILRRELDDIVCVDDNELRHAVRLLLRHTHNIAEGAGAAALAAAWQARSKLAGKRVGIILSGGNLTELQLKEILEASLDDERFCGKE